MSYIEEEEVGVEVLSISPLLWKDGLVQPFCGTRNRFVPSCVCVCVPLPVSRVPLWPARPLGTSTGSRGVGTATRLGRRLRGAPCCMHITWPRVGWPAVGRPDGPRDPPLRHGWPRRVWRHSTQIISTTPRSTGAPLGAPPDHRPHYSFPAPVLWPVIGWLGKSKMAAPLPPLHWSLRASCREEDSPDN